MAAPLLKEKRILDEWGTMMEKVGLPKDAGRVFGYLLICDPPCQTADEIALALEMDREIAGQMGEMLAQFGLGEKVSLPDKQCFVLKPVDELMQGRMKILGEFRQSLDKAYEELKDQPERVGRLKDYRDLYALFEEELPKIFERWEANR